MTAVLVATLTGLVTVVLGAVGARRAVAVGTISSPGDGAVYRSDTVVHIRALLGPGTVSAQLHVRDPRGLDVVVATGGSATGGRTLAYDLNTGCIAYPGEPTCHGHKPAPDGRWRVYLSGDASGQRTFWLAIPPIRPARLSAVAAGPTSTRLSWRLGPEPDLTSYTVLTAAGRVIRRVVPGRACVDGACTVTLHLGAKAPGGHTFEVVARRACRGCGGQLASPPSAPASVTLTGDPAGRAPPSGPHLAGVTAPPVALGGGTARWSGTPGAAHRRRHRTPGPPRHWLASAPPPASPFGELPRDVAEVSTDPWVLAPLALLVAGGLAARRRRRRRLRAQSLTVGPGLDRMRLR